MDVFCPAICQKKTGKCLQALATATLFWHSDVGHQIKLAELQNYIQMKHLYQNCLKRRLLKIIMSSTSGCL